MSKIDRIIAKWTNVGSFYSSKLPCVPNGEVIDFEKAHKIVKDGIFVKKKYFYANVLRFIITIGKDQPLCHDFVIIDEIKKWLDLYKFTANVTNIADIKLVDYQNHRLATVGYSSNDSAVHWLFQKFKNEIFRRSRFQQSAGGTYR